jgi:hypothetical protein
MKNIAHLTLGLVSSLCLAAGLNRAAELSDPLSNAQPSPAGKKLAGTSMDCTLPCFTPERSDS